VAPSQLLAATFQSLTDYCPCRRVNVTTLNPAMASMWGSAGSACSRKIPSLHRWRRIVNTERHDVDVNCVGQPHSSSSSVGERQEEKHNDHHPNSQGFRQLGHPFVVSHSLVKLLTGPAVVSIFPRQRVTQLFSFVHFF
jgi:hypothetical protein